MKLSNDSMDKLKKSGYRFVGENAHSAVKICHWTKKSIINEGSCYKEKFYGINSHRCLQMSPSVPFCQQECVFCWRNLKDTSHEWSGDHDEPKDIIEDSIEKQRNLLCGFFGNPKSDPKKLKESQNPNNAAISLAGEPTLYPKIDSLIGEFTKRKFTTFLVSNGNLPERLKNLENEPTQLYVSLDSPNKELFKKLCNPQNSDSWNKLNESLELLSSFNSRTCIRTTCVKHKNMIEPENYAKLIEKSNPKYIEIKAYMCVGDSRKRLTLRNMPSFNEVYEFADEIASFCGRKITNSSEISRVVLLE